MFLWTAKTLADAMREHQPNTAALLERIAAAWGTPKFDKVFAELYPQCESISIDYAVLEPRSAKGRGQVRALLPARRLRLERSRLMGRSA